MYTILHLILLLWAILMILVVLLQPGKGDLTATFGGISSQFGQVFGMQKATDLLAKITKWIAVVILLLILITNKFFVGQKSEEVRQVKPVTEGAQIPAAAQPNLTPPPIKQDNQLPPPPPNQ